MILWNLALVDTVWLWYLIHTSVDRLPEYFVVPTSLTDSDIKNYAPHFIGHRVPVSNCFTWFIKILSCYSDQISKELQTMICNFNILYLHTNWTVFCSTQLCLGNHGIHYITVSWKRVKVTIPTAPVFFMYSMSMKICLGKHLTYLMHCFSIAVWGTCLSPDHPLIANMYLITILSSTLEGNHSSLFHPLFIIIP